MSDAHHARLCSVNRFGKFKVCIQGGLSPYSQHQTRQGLDNVPTQIQWLASPSKAVGAAEIPGFEA
jgi:hypothetical protein